MSDGQFTLRISSNCLIVTPQGTLTGQHLEQIRQSALEKLHQGAVGAIIIDMSGIELIDSVEFAELHKLLKMATLMGAKPMLAGINYAIASALVEMNLDFGDITHAHSVDDALRINY